MSVYVTAPDLVTVHPWGTGPVSFATANGTPSAVASATAAPFGYASDFPRLVDSVDVQARRARGSVVVLGDSITDDFNTTVRWTDLLQKRIDQLAPGDRRAIVNEGITANTLDPLADDYSRTGGGIAGLRRLAVDALSQPGVSYLVLFLGTNDLFFGAIADQVIAGMRDLIARAHRDGVKVSGVTLLPRAGSERWDPRQFPSHEPYRQQVNRWIRTSRAFDVGEKLAGHYGPVDVDGRAQIAALQVVHGHGRGSDTWRGGV